MPVLHRSIVRFSSVIFASLLASATLAADSPLFNRDIRPILSANCFQCHGPDSNKREAELRIDEEAGNVSAFGGKLAKSKAWRRIISDDPDTRMPPVDSHLELKPEQIALLKAWIESGAEWEGHWSFIAPQKPPVPTTSKPGWVKNSIDAFILK
ncbi:MAG: c-type cytochrome domain-containing protein, partial [Planctomycetales bacterium]